jgi:chromate reductase, NAD(P)H dehydrogenase (quinone)
MRCDEGRGALRNFWGNRTDTPCLLRFMKVLALSGSLRAKSINSMLLRAAALLAPSEISVLAFPNLGDLPLFNPDRESDCPGLVREYQRLVAESDALIIASPEYAHGVTGTIKNALDWLVGFEPFASKPVAVLNASPRARHADAALRETLKTMAAVIVESASITIPLLGAGLDESGMIETPAVAGAIRQSLDSLQQAVALLQGVESPTFSMR